MSRSDRGRVCCPGLTRCRRYPLQKTVNHSVAELKERAWLSLFDEREAAVSSARVPRERVLMASASKRNSIWSVIVPADGTRTATVGNGDFGTSPIFGQLSDKPLLACSYYVGCRAQGTMAEREITGYPIR